MAEPPIRIGGSPHRVELTAVAPVCSGAHVAQKEAPPKRGLFCPSSDRAAAPNFLAHRVARESRTQLRSRTGALPARSRPRRARAPAAVPRRRFHRRRRQRRRQPARRPRSPRPRQQRRPPPHYRPHPDRRWRWSEGQPMPPRQSSSKAISSSSSPLVCIRTQPGNARSGRRFRRLFVAGQLRLRTIRPRAGVPPPRTRRCAADG